MTKNRTIYTKRINLIFTCVLSCVFYLVSSHSNAQQYPFINYDQSKLRFGKDSSQFMDFYKKIDELRDGKEKK